MDATAEILEQYSRDGYILVEHLFPKERLEALKNEMKKVLSEVSNNKTAGSNDFRKNGVYVGLAAKSSLFKEAAAEPRIVEALQAIIGDQVVFLSDKVVYKSADVEFESPWHQDWPYWKGSHKVSVWIALDDARIDNGCLKIIPGSHKWGIINHAGETSDGLGFDNRINKAEIDENVAVSVELTAGSAILFHDLLLHASHRNTSGKDRWSLISTYKDGRAEDPAYRWATAAFTVTG